MPWLREGDCPPERCGGSCCRSVGVWFLDSTAAVKPFLHLLQVKGVPVMGRDGDYLAQIPFPCQYLTDAGLCGLHPSQNPNHNLPHRPEFCDDWPTEPAQLLPHPDCGFSFRWEEEEIGALHG